MPTVLILGATSTIGRAVAAEFAADGYELLLAGRDAQELCSVAADLHLRYRVRTSAHTLNVLEVETHAAVIESCLRDQGQVLKGLVLCIGYLGDQAAAQVDFREAQRILDTNFVGCISILNLLAEYFHARGSGFICGISSVAGDRGRRSNYIYGAAKAGLSVYLEGLGHRLSGTQVHVVNIKLGIVDTKMTFGRPGVILAASPERVARAIYRAIRKKRSVAYVPWFWGGIMLILRCLPNRLFRHLRL